MHTADAATYDAILELLKGQAFVKPTPHAKDRLLYIARNLENWVTTALSAFSPTFAGLRVELASRTAHLVLKHLDVVDLVS